jgi:hypothetical protein
MAGTELNILVGGGDAQQDGGGGTFVGRCPEALDLAMLLDRFAGLGLASWRASRRRALAATSTAFPLTPLARRRVHVAVQFGQRRHQIWLLKKPGFVLQSPRRAGSGTDSPTCSPAGPTPRLTGQSI